ncbi:MAG: tetratricopeptide repeat protein [Bacteroidales bacterium]|nr:tetratricopeptide repeat protein [Bacteroidales bacterium]
MTKMLAAGALELIKTKLNKKGIFIAMLLLGITISFNTTVCSAQNRADSLKKVIGSTSDEKEKILALVELAHQFTYSNPAKGIEYSAEALKLAKAVNFEGGQMKAYLGLSLHYFLTSDLQMAMQSALEARSLALKLDSKKELAISNDAIGIVYYDIGDKKKSSEYFFESLKIYESLKDKTGMGQTYCRIGTLYLDQNEYDKALEYYSQSVKLAREINSKEGIASNLNNVAKVYNVQKEYKKALNQYSEALKINQSTGNRNLEASNYLNISEVYSNEGEYNLALDYVLKARKIYYEIGNDLRIAKCYFSAASIYLKLGKLNDVIVNADKALLMARKQGSQEVVMQAAGILTETYLQQKDTIKAFRYFQLENRLKDSLSAGERQKTLTKLELQYQFEKNEQKEKIREQRRMVIISIIFLCLIFGIIIIVLIMNHIRLKAKKSLLEKENLQQELDFKKKELTLNVMSLMKKNEIFSDISEKLMALAKEAGSQDTKSAIRKIGKELQKGQEDELWKEFTLRFKEVHSDFYNTLLSKYPNLSPNEQKLCAFLRLNMTSKEISELTGQSVSTIEIARHRLRQKLGITNSDVNLITFLSHL